MNKRIPIIIAALSLAVGVVGAIIAVISTTAARQPIPNFIDSGQDPAKGQELLDDYKARLDAHLDSGAPVIDAFFSEIRLVDFATVGIAKEHVLADLGCGVGTLPLALLAQEVPFKKIYALDVNKFSLEFLRYALDVGGLPKANRVFPKRSKYTDIMLQDDALDILFIVEVPAIYYSLTMSGHYDGDGEAFARMEKLFTTIRRALKSDGELHFIYPTETPTSGDLNPDALVAALDKVGFRLVQQSALMLQVENYYFIFAQKESRQSKRPARVPTAID
jgi:SAM-dependent methyltransferase